MAIDIDDLGSNIYMAPRPGESQEAYIRRVGAKSAAKYGGPKVTEYLAQQGGEAYGKYGALAGGSLGQGAIGAGAALIGGADAEQAALAGGKGALKGAAKNYLGSKLGAAALPGIGGAIGGLEGALSGDGAKASKGMVMGVLSGFNPLLGGALAIGDAFMGAKKAKTGGISFRRNEEGKLELNRGGSETMQSWSRLDPKKQQELLDLTDKYWANKREDPEFLQYASYVPKEGHYGFSKSAIDKVASGDMSAQEAVDLMNYDQEAEDKRLQVGFRENN